jgi:Flp pilus assembly protein TadG
MNRNTHQRRIRSGATLVETAVVIGIALIFMFAIFEYGRYVMFRQILENAAREGARQAVVNTSTQTTADIQATVTRYLSGQTLTGLSIQVYKADINTGANLGPWTSAAFGEGVCVEVSGTYKAMLPSFGFLPTTSTMRAKAIMRSEAN